MIFSSYEFLFVFFPLAVLGFHGLRRMGASNATLEYFLIAASLVFYSYWSVSAALIIATLCAVNYAIARMVVRRRAPWPWTVIGVGLSIAALIYYKYVDFIIAQLNHALGLSFPPTGVVLPIGISFVTFQQIAFLVDAYQKKIVSADDTSPASYFLFIFFFPHAIAGPIVHHKEMVPQFAKLKDRGREGHNIAVGLTLFILGMAKKLLLADPLSYFASSIFLAADSGVTPSGVEAWLGALAFTLQLYFDFSGYSDMAIGLARMFGIVLPVNFFSPYKSTSLVEFWRRWHITLSRFLRDYIYIPLGGNRKGAFRRHLNLLATMAIGGIWHGANWTFLAWGVLHGLGLLANHAMTASLGSFAERRLGRSARRLGTCLGWLVTFVFVVFGWVLFRATSLEGASRMMVAMVDISDRFLPNRTLALLGDLGARLRTLGLADNGTLFLQSPLAWALYGLPLLVVGLAIALLAPNTSQILARFGPVQYSESRIARLAEQTRSPFLWRPNVAWALVISGLVIASILRMSDVSEFLYFQF